MTGTPGVLHVSSDLDDLDRGQVSGELQVFGVAVGVEAVAQDANRLIFARRPRTPEFGKAGDELGHLSFAPRESGNDQNQALKVRLNDEAPGVGPRLLPAALNRNEG